MSSTEQRAGILFVISAPSGTGKSTLAGEVLERTPGLEFSISCTTRSARNGELEGREYHFIERSRFEEMIETGQFLEWAEVFGELYGTGLQATRERLAEGTDLLLDIDVQGAGQVRRGPLEAVSIMILPPNFETLRWRLLGRGSEGARQLERRLAQSLSEARDYEAFDYLVVNDELEQAVSDVEAIVRAERLRARRQAARVRKILATFPS